MAALVMTLFYAANGVFTWEFLGNKKPLRWLLLGCGLACLIAGNWVRVKFVEVK